MKPFAHWLAEDEYSALLLLLRAYSESAPWFAENSTARATPHRSYVNKQGFLGPPVESAIMAISVLEEAGPPQHTGVAWLAAMAAERTCMLLRRQVLSLNLAYAGVLRWCKLLQSPELQQELDAAVAGSAAALLCPQELPRWRLLFLSSLPGLLLGSRLQLTAAHAQQAQLPDLMALAVGVTLAFSPAEDGSNISTNNANTGPSISKDDSSDTISGDTADNSGSSRHASGTGSCSTEACGAGTATAAEAEAEAVATAAATAAHPAAAQACSLFGISPEEEDPEAWLPAARALYQQASKVFAELCAALPTSVTATSPSGVYGRDNFQVQFTAAAQHNGAQLWHAYKEPLVLSVQVGVEFDAAAAQPAGQPASGLDITAVCLTLQHEVAVTMPPCCIPLPTCCASACTGPPHPGRRLPPGHLQGGGGASTAGVVDSCA